MKKFLGKIAFGIAIGCFGFVSMLFIASAACYMFHHYSNRLFRSIFGLRKGKPCEQPKSAYSHGNRNGCVSYYCFLCRVD